MKKSLIKLALSAACATVLVSCMVGCGNNVSLPNGSNGAATNIESPLKYGVKYINESDVRKPAVQQNYITFAEDGTGKCHEYYKHEYSEKTSIYSYTVNFKYVFSDAHKTRVTCFYDSIDYDAVDTQKTEYAAFCSTLEVSENVLLYFGTYGYSEYISESYLPQIPNFWPEAD